VAKIIAFSGKGGTGKTTLAALTIRYLMEGSKGPVLAVDADANACLNEALGVRVHATVGSLREEALEAARSGQRLGGMSMEELFDYQVQQCLVEARGFDLLVMGRPEGPGCYCAANNIIRKYTDKLSAHYPYVVIDNEAGMEHLSRRTSHRVDLLLVVSDPTKKGILTAGRINSLVEELALEVSKRALLINRVGTEEPRALGTLAQEVGLEVAGLIPQDHLVAAFDPKGRPVIELPPEAPSLKALFEVLKALGV